MPSVKPTRRPKPGNSSRPTNACSCLPDARTPSPGTIVDAQGGHPSELLQAIRVGTVARLCVEPDGQFRDLTPQPCALLAGAFNPVHHGHWQMAVLAARRTNLPVAFEVSVVNVDKPPLTHDEVRHRLAQFAWQGRVWLTRAPTFAEKAPLFPGSVFVVGADTAARVVHPRYYGGSEGPMLAALEAIRREGCRFLVCGREDTTGRFLHCDELPIPASARELFEAVAEGDFRVSVSSTALRERAAALVDRAAGSA